ncbi:MAG: HEAT repeat domain-containing protein [Candidatus Magnetomorum sp.]|nr:HEAT repeat domain-containing protein [Candidatus Magnetomorum sp.]
MNIPKRLYTRKYRRLLSVIFAIIAVTAESYAFLLIWRYLHGNAGWQTLLISILIHAVPSILFSSLSLVARFSITDDLIEMLQNKNIWGNVIDRLKDIQQQVFVLDKDYQAAVEKAMVMDPQKLLKEDVEHYLESKNIVMKYMMFTYSNKERDDIRRLYYFSHLTAWISFFMPMIGLFGCLAVYVSIVGLITSKGLAEDYQEETSYSVEEDPLPDSVKNHEAFLSNELDVEPIRDILTSDDPDMKRGAVDYLGRIGSPEAVRLLKQCLADDSPEVRFMSHTMLGRIDEKHIRRIKDIQTDLSKASSEDQPILQEKLGYCYKAYTDSELLEVSTRDYYLKQSEDAYLANLSLTKSNDPNILFTLAQIYTMLNEAENAKTYFENAWKSALEIEAYMLTLRAMIGLAEWLYKEYHYMDLIQIVNKMPDIIEKGYEQYKNLHQENPKNIIIRKLFLQFTFLSARKAEFQLLQETFQEDDPMKAEHIGIISFWLNSGEK